MSTAVTYSFAIVFVLLLFGCGGSGSPVNEPDSEGDTQQSSDTIVTNTGGSQNTGSVDTNDNSSTGNTDEQSTEDNPSDTSNNTGAIGANIRYLGYIAVFDWISDADRTLTMSGGFFERDPWFDNNFDPDVFTTDTCDLTGIADVPVAPVSAGETIIVSNAAGTLAELLPIGITNFQQYNTAELLSVDSQQGSNLVVDIPGDDYPPFGGVAVPDAELPTGISPQLNSNVNADTVFRWNAGSTRDTHIAIGILFGGSASVSCYLIDDGEFTLPDSVKSQVGTATVSSWSLGRRHFVTLERGDAILQVQRYTGFR